MATGATSQFGRSGEAVVKKEVIRGPPSGKRPWEISMAWALKLMPSRLVTPLAAVSTRLSPEAESLNLQEAPPAAEPLARKRVKPPVPINERAGILVRVGNPGVSDR